MDEEIFSFCRSLSAFCNHVESSSKALSDSVQRRPIPRDSAATAFLKSLERRIDQTSSDLNLLHSLAFDTVSFEELLGHCNEVYKANDELISEIEERMRSFGYVPDSGLVDEEVEELGADVKVSGTTKGFRLNTMHLEEDELLDSISLKNLGISDASLAAIASEDPECYSSTKLVPQEITSYGDFKSSPKSLINECAVGSLNFTGASKKAGIKIVEDDYDKLPAFMKKLSSWEELHEAVDKINSYISKKDGFSGSYTLDQGVLEMLDLGRKGRVYLLMLLRMNRISAETVNGSILYHFNSNSS